MSEPGISLATDPDSLRSSLKYEPLELQFGTSGRRGKVADLTQLEVYINARAELEYLQSLDVRQGGIIRGDEFYFARDLRPSSDRFVPEQDGRGEIAQAIVSAIRDAGMRPINLGLLPTPALMCYAVARNRGSIMVTGSHIPFDRNGYKLNSSTGELLKQQEGPIGDRVWKLRQTIYAQRRGESRFDERGRFKVGHQELPPEDPAARTAWVERFTTFFQNASLKGRRIVVYQHSAVGRDLLVELIERFQAEVIPAGRSDAFVPIDTENIGEAQLAAIQRLVGQARAKHGAVDAVVSTDGDSDRPLILDVNRNGGKVRFFPGDLVGMITAEYLGADAVVVPISCNDAIDRGTLASRVEPKTRIGSPFVIAGMEQARSKGRRRICGWEPNGGFLTGSAIGRDGAVLPALLTRDAFLPILTVLFAAAERGISLTELFATLPKRFSRAALLPHFPRSTSSAIMAFLSLASDERSNHEAVRERLARFFSRERGFGAVGDVDYTDGVRVTFDNGDVAHVRPSGNADELRIYAVADTQARADEIVAMGIAEPDGILRSIEKAVTR